MAMVHDELGKEWLCPELFRIGASALLGNIERALTELSFGQKELGNIPIPVV
jgi:deoxyribose-phosphate aldolase